MHTAVFVRFLKWARIVGHLSSPFAIFLHWLNHSLFPPKSCTVFLNLSLLTSYLTTSCSELHILFLIGRIYLFCAYCTISYWKPMLYQISFWVVWRKYKGCSMQNQPSQQTIWAASDKATTQVDELNRLLLPFIKWGYYHHSNHIESSIVNVENTEVPTVRVQRLPVWML